MLAARFGDLDLADESVQDALVQAVETWGAEGIPANPAGWLYTVARNRAIDRLRRAAASARRLTAAAPELVREPGAPEEVPIVEHPEVGDEQLRLMLLCCHPALHRGRSGARASRCRARPGRFALSRGTFLFARHRTTPRGQETGARVRVAGPAGSAQRARRPSGAVRLSGARRRRAW
nr:sigma factor [Microbacterium pygmaeum]